MVADGAQVVTLLPLASIVDRIHRLLERDPIYYYNCIKFELVMKMLTWLTLIAINVNSICRLRERKSVYTAVCDGFLSFGANGRA